MSHLSLELGGPDGQDVLHGLSSIVLHHFIVVVSQALEQGGEGGASQAPLRRDFCIGPASHILLLAWGASGAGWLVWSDDV